jgi:hypothetical protein
MVKENQALLQGARIQPGVLPMVEIQPGYVCILHSGYGIEGVYTDWEILLNRIKYLRTLTAYRAAALSYSLHPIDAEVHT